MHNIHQNQGDPAGSQWWGENGIWQDGGTLAEQPDGSWIAFHQQVHLTVIPD
jgi:uncharacterized protein YukJ